ncbi:uncharacterized protein ACNLHF_014263 isoform 2-T2 [Anomaloglossus baeobatrachus]
MKLSPIQYRARLYHIEMATSKSIAEDSESISACTDHAQACWSDTDSKSTSGMYLHRRGCMPCLYHGNSLSSDTEEEFGNVFQEQRQDMAERSLSSPHWIKNSKTECFQLVMSSACGSDTYSKSTSGMYLHRRGCMPCLYHGNILSSDTEEEFGNVFQEQRQDMAERSFSSVHSKKTKSKTECLQLDQLEMSSSQEISERSPTCMHWMKSKRKKECLQLETSPNLIQYNEERNPLTTRARLCDLLEDQRVLLSSYINVLKTRLLSSLGVIKTPIPGKKARDACHPPS